MDMKTVVLISFVFGLIAGWRNDKSFQNLYGKLTLADHIIVPSTIIFVIYAFFQSYQFGFMALLQIVLGTYIGGKLNRLVKKAFNR